MLMLKRLLRSEKMSQKDLAAQLGIDEASMSLIVNGRRDLSIEMRKAIDALFGADKVAQFDIQPITQPTQVQATIYPSGVIDDLREELRSEYSQPKAEDVEVAEGDTVSIAEPVIVPPAIMQRPKTDSKEWVESREAQANADRLQIAGILKATDMVWKVEDEAMQPTLFQGEYVLIKEMDDEARIIDGRVYAIDTKYHGNLIRRVYDDGDNYRLDPINKDGFSSVTISKEGGFNRRYRILCHISTEISILPDVDEERRRQDRLIEEVGRAGNRVDRLIDLLEKKN